MWDRKEIRLDWDSARLLFRLGSPLHLTLQPSSETSVLKMAASVRFAAEVISFLKKNVSLHPRLRKCGEALLL